MFDHAPSSKCLHEICHNLTSYVFIDLHYNLSPSLKSKLLEVRNYLFPALSQTPTVHIAGTKMFEE
jgi:hypothetical protein